MKQILYYFHFDGNYYAGDHIDIHNNQSVNIYQGQQSNTTTPTVGTTTVEEVTPVATKEDVTLFKYIHPSITADEDKRQVHCEVQNLVQQFSMSDICRYLRQMCKEHRVYLNVKPEAMFAELHRMGMPSESMPGFSYKNFMNYFNIND